MYEDLTLQGYLDTILSKEQQHILAYCLKNDVRVCLTDSSGGKLAITRLFEKAGYSVINGPEEGVTYIIGIGKDFFEMKRFTKIFTVTDIKRWLRKTSECQFIRKKYDKKRYVYEEAEKENAELKRQLEERQNVKFNMKINNITIKKLIVVNGTQGDGTKDNPYQNKLFYYTLEGRFIGKTPVK